MADTLKQKERKRGSWLRRRTDESAADDAKGSAAGDEEGTAHEEAPPPLVKGKSLTFGRSSLVSKNSGTAREIPNFSQASSASPSPPAASSAPASTPAPVGSRGSGTAINGSSSALPQIAAVRDTTLHRNMSSPVVGSNAASKRSSQSYSHPPAAASAATASAGAGANQMSKLQGWTGMAAAFDAMLTQPGETEGDTLEKQLRELQAKYAQLQAAYDEMKGNYMEAEIRATDAEKRADELEFQLAAFRASPGSSSNAGQAPDAVSAEVSRVRREIKTQQQQQKLSLTTLTSTSAAAALSSDGRSNESHLSRSEERISSSSFANSNKSSSDLMDDVAIEKFENLWMTRANKYQFGDWRTARMPGRCLVAEVEGFHIESGDAALDALPPVRSYELVEPSLNVQFFTDFIHNIKHTNFVGLSGIGSFADIPVVVSVETPSVSRTAKLRRKPVIGMVRAPGGTEQLCFTGFDVPVAKLPYASTTFMEFLQQRFPMTRFTEVKGAEDTAALTKSLLQFESMNIVRTYKIGVLRWLSGQTENEAMANGPSDQFQDFLSWLGQRIELQGWSRFRGGLNVNTNVTGTHSYYATLDCPTGEIEIMFHVSTELPFSESDAQCLERKRHLGNDVVVIVFWEGDGEFDPSLVKSQFNHVFIVVTVDNSSIPELGKIRYRINVTCKTAVPRWEPYLPINPVFDRDETLRAWLLYKCINAERAAMHAPVFRTKLIKTNTTYLKSLVQQFVGDAAEGKNK